MFISQAAQGTTVGILQQSEELEILIQAFLDTKRAENVASGTLTFYKKKLHNFHTYCSTQGITNVYQISPETIRMFMLHLKERGNNDGGIHAHYRSVKTFLRWFEDEFEPDEWRNPIRKVKAPKVAQEPLEPADSGDLERMLKACGIDMVGKRNKAMIFFLMDTGTRASEMLGVMLSEIDLVTGETLIRSGKGRKPRHVFLGEMSRRAVRQYLKLRTDNHPALWVTDKGDGALSYWGLVSTFRRLAPKAKLDDAPSRHGVRRYWTLTMLMSGKTDLLSITRLGGWASVAMVQRYAKQSKSDLKQKASSPVDDERGRHD